MGERGQLVILQEFRKCMGLHRGDKFVVVGRGDTAIVERLGALRVEDFEVMLRKGMLLTPGGSGMKDLYMRMSLL